MPNHAQKAHTAATSNPRRPRHLKRQRCRCMQAQQAQLKTCHSAHGSGRDGSGQGPPHPLAKWSRSGHVTGLVFTLASLTWMVTVLTRAHPTPQHCESQQRQRLPRLAGAAQPRETQRTLDQPRGRVHQALQGLARAAALPLPACPPAATSGSARGLSLPPLRANPPS